MAVVLALAAISGSYWLGHRAGAGVITQAWEADKAQRAAAEARLQAQYRAREKEMLREREIAEQNYLAQVERSRADVAAAGSELDRLRRAVAARNSPRRAAEAPACPTIADDSATYRELFLACSAEYTDMAAEATGVADRLSGLQAHERAVQAGGGVDADTEN